MSVWRGLDKRVFYVTPDALTIIEEYHHPEAAARGACKQVSDSDWPTGKTTQYRRTPPLIQNVSEDYLVELLALFERLNYTTALGRPINVKPPRRKTAPPPPRGWTARDCDGCNHHVRREDYASNGRGGLRNISKVCHAKEKAATRRKKGAR